MLVRIALAGLAAVVCAWFVLGIVEAHDQTRATALMSLPGTPSRAQTGQILGLLDDAATLNPDRQIDLLRVQAEQRGGEAAAALKTAEAAARAEPQNAFAWVVLQFAARPLDPALAQLAGERERQLAPPVPPAR
jgi:hypothetical protein